MKPREFASTFTLDLTLTLRQRLALLRRGRLSIQCLATTARDPVRMKIHAKIGAPTPSTPTPKAADAA